MALSIVYIADSFVPSRAANSVHVMKMCAAMGALGHRVTLAVRSAPERELPADDPFAFYGVPRSFVLRKLDPTPLYSSKSTFAWRAAGWAAGTRPDLVFSRSLAASFLSAARGIPVIYESHTPEGGWASERLYGRLARSPRLRRHVVITEALKRFYVEQRGTPRERIFVAPDGADEPGSAEPVDLGGPDRVRIGYVGHLYAGRGIGLLLELARRIPEADFHLVGGTEEDVAAWGERSRSLPNLVLHGFLPPGLLDGYRSAFDVLVAPYERSVSISGGGGHDTVKWMSPLKLFEYMAAGKPIVVSRLEAIEEVVRDGETAILCAPEDVGEWERALRRLITDRAERERLGTAAAALLRERYTWAKRAETILEPIAGPRSEPDRAGAG